MACTKKKFLALIIVTITIGCSPIYTRDVKPPTFLSNKDLGVAVLSPDHQTIVFDLRSKYKSQLYKVRVNGTGLVSLGDGSTRDIDPVFSPDGSTVLFSHILKGQGDLCVMKIDGSDRKCLTSGPEHDFDPVYSPDGNEIYFLRAQVFTNYSPIAAPAWHEIDIFSINANGSGLKRITFKSNYGMSSLSINPLGDTLMVLGPGDRVNLHQIYIIPTDNPTNWSVVQPDLTKYRPKKIMLGPQKIDYSQLRNPRFSPDGTHILFSWPYHDGLYLMNLQTNQTKKIWESKKEDFGRRYPRFSRDGRQVVFSTVKKCDQPNFWGLQLGKEPEIWIVNTDGTDLHAVEIK